MAKVRENRLIGDAITVSVQVRPSTVEGLDFLAKEKGLNRASYIRMVLDEHIIHVQTMREASADRPISNVS
jgi:predicted DNA-binding protein